MAASQSSQSVSSEAPPPPGESASSTLKDLQDLLEFYFGDSNLRKDRFLRQHIESSKNGYVELRTLMTFNKVKALTTDITVVKHAAEASELLKLSRDGSMVMRKAPLPDKETDVDARTLFVDGLGTAIDHDPLKDLFSKYGSVSYVSIPRHPDRVPKGFAFIEFVTEQGRAAALGALRPSVGGGDGDGDVEMKDGNTGEVGKNLPTELNDCTILSKEEWLQKKREERATQNAAGAANGTFHSHAPSHHLDSSFCKGMVVHFSGAGWPLRVGRVRSVFEAFAPVTCVNFKEGIATNDGDDSSTTAVSHADGVGSGGVGSRDVAGKQPDTSASKPGAVQSKAQQHAARKQAAKALFDAPRPSPTPLPPIGEGWVCLKSPAAAAKCVKQLVARGQRMNGCVLSLRVIDGAEEEEYWKTIGFPQQHRTERTSASGTHWAPTHHHHAPQHGHSKQASSGGAGSHQHAKTPKYDHGLIVQFHLADADAKVDFRKIKSAAIAVAPVAFVDCAKPGVPGYLRMVDRGGAEKIMQACSQPDSDLGRLLHQATVLSGAEEQTYWAKVLDKKREHQESKAKDEKTVNNGSGKGGASVPAPAPKAGTVHVRFGADQEVVTTSDATPAESQGKDDVGTAAEGGRARRKRGAPEPELESAPSTTSLPAAPLRASRSKAAATAAVADSEPTSTSAAPSSKRSRKQATATEEVAPVRRSTRSRK